MESVTPHISANKLGEFAYATDARKRSILKTIKFPSTFKNGRYPEPLSAFRNFMLDPEHNPSAYEEKRAQIAAKSVNSDWAKGNKQNCLLAVEHLAYCSTALLSDQLRYTAEKGLANDNYDADIRNVTLHLKPEVLLVDKAGTVKGFIKLAFSKNHAVDHLEANIVVGAIKEHVENLYEIKLKPENCIILDVFRRRKFSAPKYAQVNRTQIRLICAEIAALWPTINN